MTECVFCAIVDGIIPCTPVLETDRVLAFRDLKPWAPTHVLVIPKAHHADLAALAAVDPAYVGEVYAAAAVVAEHEGLHGGHRILTNTGPDGGQTVFHFHVHGLGGRNLGALAG
jgi:histidine triad (HIT) family protein